MVVPRNPGEIARLNTELASAIEAFLGGASSASAHTLDKGTKAGREAQLSYIRSLEAQLGLESHNYNQTGFCEHYTALAAQLRKEVE